MARTATKCNEPFSGCQRLNRENSDVSRTVFVLVWLFGGETWSLPKWRAKTEVFSTEMSGLVFWVVTSYGLVLRFKRFLGTYYLYLQVWTWSTRRYYPEDEHLWKERWRNTVTSSTSDANKLTGKKPVTSRKYLVCNLERISYAEQETSSCSMGQMSGLVQELESNSRCTQTQA